MLSGVSIMSSMSLKKLEAMLLAMLPFLMWCPSTDSAKNSKKMVILCMSFVEGCSLCTCVYTDLFRFLAQPVFSVAAYRVAKTHRMPYLHRSFSAKGPYN